MLLLQPALPTFATVLKTTVGGAHHLPKERTFAVLRTTVSLGRGLLKALPKRPDSLEALF